MKALHVCLEGFTASFKHPLIISGTQISTPMPAYSTLLGMISACAGRVVKPNETRIGFEFRCKSHDIELERTTRFEFKEGRLKRHGAGQGISRRQVYWEPRLDLYLTNSELKSAFEYPVATPSFGRSQDIAWITRVKEIELRPVKEGALGPTLVPYPQEGISGLLVRLPEWFKNEVHSMTRIAGPFGRYQAMLPTLDARYYVQSENLFHPSDAAKEGDVIYLHQWL